MALTARFVADFGSFHDAVKKAESSLNLWQAEIAKVEREMKKLDDAFSGRKIIQEAAQVAGAIEKIGGVSKLTEAEQRKVNATVTEALAKYRALGEEAPAHLRKLADETAKIPDKLSLADRAANTLKGSFAQMAGSFALGGLLERGVTSLIGWSKAAVDAAGATIDLSNQTGLSTDTIQKMEHVAKQTGTELEKFTTAAFQLGTRISGGGGSVRQAVADLGLAFGDLAQLKPDDQFAAIVRELERMEDPQDRNRLAVELFGKSAREILPAIAEGYGKIADGARVSSREQLQALDEASDAWDAFVEKQKKGLQSRLGNWVMARDQVGKLTAMEQAQYAAILKSGGDAQAFLLQVREKHKDVNLEVEKSAGASQRATADWAAELRKLDAEIGKLTGSMRREIEIGRQIGKNEEEIAEKVGLTVEHLKRYDELARRAKDAISKLQHDAGELVKRVRDESEARREVNEWMVKNQQTLNGFSTARATEQLQIQMRTLDATTQSWLGMQKAISGIKIAEGLDGLRLPGAMKLPALPEFPEGMFARVAKEIDGLTNAASYLANVTGNRAVAALENWLTAVGNAERAGKQLAAGWKDMTRQGGDFIKGLSQMVQAGIAGVGSIIQATGQGSAGSRALGGAMAGASLVGSLSAMGLKLGAFGGPIGMGIGAGAGALVGWLRGRNQGRNSVEDFADSMGGFDQLRRQLNELGDEGERLWVRLTQGVGRGSAQQARAAIDEVTKALERHKMAQTDTGNAAVKAAEQMATAQKDAIDKLQGQLDGLNQEYDRLFQSIKDEAPEEEIGVVEKLTRERMASLAEQRKAIEQEMQKAQEQLAESLERVAKAMESTARSLESLTSRDWTVRVNTAMSQSAGLWNPGGKLDLEGIPQLAHGGIVRRPTLAMIGEKGPEAVVPLNQSLTDSRPLVVQVMLPSGRVLAEEIVPEFAQVLRRTGAVR